MNPLTVRQGLLGYGPGQVEHVLHSPSPASVDAGRAEGGAEELIISDMIGPFAG